MSARRRLPSIGLFVNPLTWWLRLWGLGPDREKELAEARGLVDQQRARGEDLSAQLQARQAEATALQRRLDQSRGELDKLRARLDELEGDEGELARLQSRTDDLETTAAEAAQLRARTDELEATAAEAAQLRDRIGELEAAASEAERLRAHIEELKEAQAEAERLAARVEELEQAQAEVEQLRTRVAELETEPDATVQPDEPQTEPDSERQESDGQSATSSPDVSEAASVLGSRIKLDDFTVIEGIGPKIAGLLDDAGITTWQQLSEAKPTDLREVLTSAGSRYRMHDPANWPTQAALLAGGRWQEFKDLTERVRRNGED